MFKTIEPCIYIKYINCFQNTIQKLDIQSDNSDICNDTPTLTANTKNDCSKTEFDISFDTDSGTSVDKHTFTESLTSDSLNETSPSSDTCCTVEDSRTDACDCPCITCQRASDECNCSSNTV